MFTVGQDLQERLAARIFVFWVCSHPVCVALSKLSRTTRWRPLRVCPCGAKTGLATLSESCNIMSRNSNLLQYTMLAESVVSVAEL